MKQGLPQVNVALRFLSYSEMICHSNLKICGKNPLFIVNPYV